MINVSLSTASVITIFSQKERLEGVGTNFRDILTCKEAGTKVMRE